MGSEARAVKRVKLMLEAGERGEAMDANSPEVLANSVFLNPHTSVKVCGMPTELFHAYPEANHMNPFVQTDLPEPLLAITPAHGKGIWNDGKVLPRQDKDDSVSILQLC